MKTTGLRPEVVKWYTEKFDCKMQRSTLFEAKEWVYGIDDSLATPREKNEILLLITKKHYNKSADY